MSRPRVLILAEPPEVYSEPVASRFEDVELGVCSSYKELREALSRRPSVVLASKIGPGPFPRALLFQTEGLEWVQCASAGVDHLLPLPENVRVTSASGVHDEALADYVVAAILMSNLHFPAFFRQQQARQWKPRELMPSAGQKLVVLGLGSIGTLAARKAKALGLRVIGIKARPEIHSDVCDEVLGVGQLKDAVSETDVLAVTLPKTPHTLGLVNGELFRSMKPGSVLINLSRGGIVDEAALVDALENGPLASAVVDVFETEPLPEESPLWELENLVITPHTGDIEGWQSRVAELFCDNLARFRRGEELLNVVDPQRGY